MSGASDRPPGDFRVLVQVGPDLMYVWRSDFVKAHNVQAEDLEAHLVTAGEVGDLVQAVDREVVNMLTRERDAARTRLNEIVPDCKRLQAENTRLQAENARMHRSMSEGGVVEDGGAWEDRALLAEAEVETWKRRATDRRLDVVNGLATENEQLRAALGDLLRAAINAVTGQA